nr:efflux RND transporter periplasmic adaptor subunit [Halomonas socia]
MIRRHFQWFVLAAALCLAASVGLYVIHQMGRVAERQPPAQPALVQRPSVAVLHVQASRHEARVEGYGELRPRHELNVIAQVAGQVLEMADGFETGRQLSRGELLVRLEDESYREALASAEATLASARVTLLEEQRQGQQAGAEWRSAGLAGEPDSELVLRQPQLAAAQAALRHAERSLASAQRDLEHTRIVAPFDALVVSRAVAPGSYLQAGSEVATLYSTERFEAAVPLSADHWSRLLNALAMIEARWPVELLGVETGERWLGYVQRVEYHQGETRQRSLVVAVESPLERQPALLPGTFVEVHLAGRSLDGLWKLPASALSQNGEIWYVQASGTLASFAADVLFSDQQAIYVAAPRRWPRPPNWSWQSR